jgi:hypothetical protein
VSKKGMICNCPTDIHMRNLRQKAERGTKTSSQSTTTRVPRASCFEKSMRSVLEIWGRTYNVLPQSANGMRKWDKKLDSCAAKKGAN